MTCSKTGVIALIMADTKFRCLKRRPSWCSTGSMAAGAFPKRRCRCCCSVGCQAHCRYKSRAGKPQVFIDAGQVHGLRLFLSSFGCVRGNLGGKHGERDGGL